MRTLFLFIPVVAALTAGAQQKITVNASERNTAALLAEKFESRYLAPEPPSQAGEPAALPAEEPKNVTGTVARAAISLPPQWKKISGSMNIYGTTISEARPLQYEDEMQVVSFVHRKSASYIPRPFPIPDAESGAIVAVFSANWGMEWDTTLLWNSDNYWGRYPQGGIYHNPFFPCLNKSQFVATGPLTTDQSGWAGSFVTSKALDIINGPANNDTVSTGFTDHYFLSSSNPVDPIGKIDFPSHDFTITDDGVVRSLGYLVNDVNATGAGFGFQGASILKGMFTSGDFIWSIDSIVPQFYTSPGGTLHIGLTPHMAWNESGTVGYVWFIGVREPRPGQGDTISNMGFQPIIFKTTNSGATWTEMPRINFNDTSGAYNAVFRQILAVRNDSIGIPFFNVSEGIDGIVDRNDRLHIVTTVLGTARKHPDSLGFTFLITHNDGEQYNFVHKPGLRPYIFDFTETNQATWKVTLIDSMSSEGPGRTTGSEGYDDNPWDAAGGTSGTDKVDVDARIQVSRTPDGRYIVYTWAESDTAFTPQGHKWNARPNVKAHMAEVGLETSSAAAGLTLHPMEINITNPANNTVPPYTKTVQVQDRATNHFISPKCAVISSTASSGVAICLPVTVSNSTSMPFKQASPINHWYLSANLNFDNLPLNSLDGATVLCNFIDVAVEGVSPATVETLYPNPAQGSINVHLNRKYNGKCNLRVVDVLGAVLLTATVETGQTTLTLDVSSLSPGVYFIQFENAKGTATKLIIQR